MNHNTKILARTHCLGKQQQPNPPRQYYFLYLLIICLFSFAATPACAATYHLDNRSPGGDGTTSALSGTNAAFDTISACQTALDALGDNGSGDTVIVHEGDGTSYGRYYDTQTRTAYLTWQAAADEDPIFKDFYSSNTTDTYLKFDGLTFERNGDVHSNADGKLCFAKGNYVLYENLTIKGDSYRESNGITVTYGIFLSNYQNVMNCTITDQGDGLSFLYGIYVGTDASYENTTITSCEIENAYDAIVIDSCENIIIDDCHIHDCKRDGIVVAEVDGITITDCQIHDLYPALTFSDTTAASYDKTTKIITISAGTPYDDSWGGSDSYVRITAGGSYVTSINAATGTREYALHPIASSTTSTITLSVAEITDNYSGTITKIEVFDNAGHSDFIQLQDVVGEDVDNVVIQRVKAYNSYRQGFYMNTDSTNNLTVENCLIYDVDANIDWRPRGAPSYTGMKFKDNMSGDIIIRNNTVNRMGGEGAFTTFTGNIIKEMYMDYDGGNLSFGTESYNIWATELSTMSTYSAGTGTLVLGTDGGVYTAYNTLFADIISNDYSLAPNSAAVNFVSISAPVDDIIGISRDASPDAGAYEYTGPYFNPTIGDKSVDEEATLSFTITATDPDGDPITYSAAGTAITAGGVLTGQNFAWTPNGSQAGTYQATFTATAGGQTDFETITITVNNVINTAPVLASIGSKSGSEGLLIGFTTSASDSDFPANDLTFSLEGTPPTGASIDAVTGYFTWVPTEAQGPGTYNVTVRVTDDGTGNLYDEEVVAITVSEVNASPTLSTIGSKSANEGALLTFTASANDNDVPANTLSFSLINAPAGASIGSGTGVFAWTPSESHGSNSYSVTVRVTDNGSPNLYDEETINISVTETNTDPVLDPIGDKATNVGSQLTFTANATDADVPANTLTYSLTTAPAGASIGSETGVFTWTPSSGYEQTFNVTVRVTDDGAGTLFDEETITITVGPDVTDPTVTNLSPADADVQVSIDSLIILTIADAGIGVDLNTVTIDVDGDRIYDGGSETSEGVYESTGNVQTVKGICRRTGTSAAYSFFFQADARFDYEKNITVTVNASDLASTSNDMAEQSYSFYTVMREFEGNAKVNSDTGTLVQDRPAVAKDSDGNIWAVWDQTTIAGDTDVYIGKLAVDDSAFGESTQVTSDTNNQRNAVIAIDSNNKIYLAWQDYRQGEWDVYLATSTDGVTFSTETRITDPNSNQINPDIAIDSSDKVYIVWEDDQNSNNDIYIASSTNSFVSKTTSQITSNASGQGSPAIAIDSAKTVYVVWTDARNASNDIYGATSTSGPWTNAAIVNNANGQSSPVIATETSGTVLHLLWVDDTSGDNDIFYGATTGGLAGLPLTGTDISDDTTSSDQSNPSIFATGTTGSNLRVFACWKDSRDVVNNNADTDIYYGETALGGSTFGTNVLVNDDSGTNTQSVPVVNVDINGNPYLAWVDNRGGNKDIYYAGAMLMGSVLVTSPLITVGTGGTVEVDDTTSNIDSATDVRVVIPAGTLPADTTITISEMINPPSPPSGGFGVNYEFGPSGLVFNSPVTIYLPHAAADCPGHAVYRAYWYNLELSAWYPPGGIAAQHGVDPVSGVHYITFETDHFTGFGVGGGSAGGGGGGGGGCSMSPDGQGTIVEFLVPYIGLAIVMAIMKLKGRRKKNLHRYTGSD